MSVKLIISYRMEQGRPKLIASRFFLFSAALLAAPAITASADLTRRDSFIEVRAGLLAVKLENASLSEVLRNLGDQAGVRVIIHGNLGNVQPQVFSGIPVSEGVKRLMDNGTANVVMIYGRDKAGRRYLKEIRAYEGNSRHSSSRPTNAGMSKSVPPPLPARLRRNASSSP